ncbi:MAG: DUF5058 family protein [Candidatus Izemoplasmatales bacterium]|jgi:hypothetical protein
MQLAITDVSLVKECWWMYLLGALVTLFIAGGAVYFAVIGFRQAKKLGMPKETLKKTVISSLSFSILPSIGIFIGVITMAGLLGIPLPWIRLSVVGALHYELMAVSVASEGITALTMTTQDYVTIAFAMTISIMWGGIFALIFFKKYQTKVLNKVVSGNERSFGKLLFDAVFIGMISAYLGDAFAKIFRYDTKIVVDGAYVVDEMGNYVLEDNKTFVPLIVFLSSMLFMGLLDLLVKKGKQKWLENFQLALSMLLGMMVAVLLGLGGIY